MRISFFQSRVYFVLVTSYTKNQAIKNRPIPVGDKIHIIMIPLIVFVFLPRSDVLSVGKAFGLTGLTYRLI